MKPYDEFHDGEWDDLQKTFKPKWKKVHPKDVRGMLDPNMQTNDARRENREMRKRMARRMRRVDKRETRNEYDLGN